MPYENIPLSEFKWFRRAIYIPLLLSVLTALVIFSSEFGLDRMCIRGDCFNNLYDIYRVPVWLAGLSLALSGIVAAVHRSSQTSKQIDMAQRQLEAASERNSFDLFVKHQEVFVSGISNLLDKYNSLDSDSNNKITVNVQYLYSKIFDNTPLFFQGYYAKDGFYISRDFLTELANLYFEARDGSSYRYTADLFEDEYKISRENLSEDIDKETYEEKAKFAMRYCDFGTEVFQFIENTFIKKKV